MISSKKKQFLTVIFLNLGIALIGGSIIYYATIWGTWAFSDSATYFAAARNLAAGDGMVIHKTNGGIYLYRLFAPFYPMLLSVFYILIGDIFTVARIVNIIAFIIFLTTFGFILFVESKKIILSLIGPVLLLVSPMMIESFTGAMTEPVFFSVLILTFLFSYLYFENPSWQNLIPYVITLSLLPFTRYAGIGFIFSNILVILLLLKKPLINKLKSSLIIGLLSSIPTLIWLGYLYINSNQIGGRRLELPQFFLENIFSGFKIISELVISWLPYSGIYEDFLPSSTRFLILTVTFFVLISATWFMLIKKSKENVIENNLLIIMIIHFFSFIFFIPFSYSLTNRSFVIDQRILAPVIPIIIALALLSLNLLISQLRRYEKLFLALVIVIFGLIIRFYFLKSRNVINELHLNGYGYTSRQYQESGIISEIKKIPPNKILISNLSGFVLLYDNRLPIQVNQFQYQMYGSGRSDPEVLFRRENAALLFFIPDFRNYYRDQANDLYEALTNGLVIGYEDPVSAIYYYPD